MAKGLQTFKKAELFRVCANVLVPDGSKNSTVKHIFEVLLSQSRTLHIVVSSYPVGQPSGLAVAHWFGAPLVQVNEDVHIMAKVCLCPNQNDGRVRVASADLWDPFGSDVIEGDRVDQAEAQNEDIHVGIAQGAKMTKLLLSDPINRNMMRKGLSKDMPVWCGRSTCPAVSISLIRVGIPFTWTKPRSQ